MVSLLAALAWAGPLDPLAPLPACTPDAGPQLILPMRVLGLWFDGDGDLWVADWAGLTHHDGETLATLQRLHPGTHGWSGIEADETGVLADNALGPSWHVEGSGRVRRGRLDLFRLFHDIARPRATVPTPDLPDEGPFGPAEPPERAVVQEMLTGSARVRPVRTTAIARRESDGSVAVATSHGLHLVGPDGALRVSRPLTWSTEASGLVRDRLFTVSRGVLRVWSGDGDQGWEAPGVWSGAVARDDDLVLADLRGRLWTLDLDVGEPKARACVTGDCRASRLPGGVPREGEPEVLGPQALGWAEGLQAWLDAHPPVPLALAVVDGEIVAAELHPTLWMEAGITQVTALHRVNRSGRRVVASRVLDEPVIGTLQAGGPGGFQVGDQPYLVGDLAPVGQVRDPDGPHVLVETSQREREGGARVTVGFMRDGELEPAQGLPPRLVTQLRGPPRVLLEGDRFVLSGVGGSTEIRGSVPPGSTEVWCVPRQDGPPASVRPGVLAEPRYGEGDTDIARLADQLGAREPGPVTGGVRVPVLDEASANGPVFVLQVRGAVLPSVVPDLLALGLSVRVHSDTPAPEGLPAGVIWVRDSQPVLRGVRSLSLVSHGIALWTGEPSAFHPEILAASVGSPPDPDLVQRWTDGPGKVREVAKRTPTALDIAIEAEHWPAVRRLMQESTQRVAPEVIARAWTDAPLPEGIRWERAPDTAARWLLAIDSVRQELVWDASDTLGLPAAMVWTRRTKHVHPGLATGVWEGRGTLPLSGLLVMEGDVIRAVLPWNATVDAIREALP